MKYKHTIETSSVRSSRNFSSWYSSFYCTSIRSFVNLSRRDNSKKCSAHRFILSSAYFRLNVQKFLVWNRRICKFNYLLYHCTDFFYCYINLTSKGKFTLYLSHSWHIRVFRSSSVFLIALQRYTNSRYKGIRQIGVHCISINFNYHIIFHLLLLCIYFDKTISYVTKNTMYEIRNCAFSKKLKYLQKKMKH